MDFINIATTGNAVDFGDAIVQTQEGHNGIKNSWYFSRTRPGADATLNLSPSHQLELSA